MAAADQTTNRSEGEQRPAAPTIALPKGGGTIRGIGEKFAANPVTGTFCGRTTRPHTRDIAECHITKIGQESALMPTR